MLRCVPCRLLCTASTVPRSETAHRTVWARVVDVYDGDTFTILFEDHDGKIRRRRCRTMGYDAPEMRDKTKKAEAIAARVRLRELLPSCVFLLRICGLDKYGRLLVKMPRICKKMIEEGHGYEYYGGTKF